MNSEDASRYIPSPIKREVRQRCGFGCVVCGIPLYEYDHIEDWAIVKQHQAENITLLCDRHHKEKTNGLLSKKQIIEADANPYNLKNKSSTPYNFHFEGKDFEIQLGGLTLTLDNVNPKKDFIIPFVVENNELISFEIIDNQLFFNLTVFDKDDNILLKIEENQLVYSTDQWDIEFIGNNLTLREARRQIIFDIDFLIPNKVKINRGIFNYKGWEIRVDENAIHAYNMYFQAKGFNNFRVGFVFGKYDKPFQCVVWKNHPPPTR